MKKKLAKGEEGTTPERAKKRVKLFGLAKWLEADDVAAYRKRALEIRGEKTHWSYEAWKKKLDDEVRTNWQGERLRGRPRSDGAGAEVKVSCDRNHNSQLSPGAESREQALQPAAQKQPLPLLALQHEAHEPAELALEQPLQPAAQEASSSSFSANSENIQKKPSPPILLTPAATSEKDKGMREAHDANSAPAEVTPAEPLQPAAQEASSSSSWLLHPAAYSQKLLPTKEIFSQDIKFDKLVGEGTHGWVWRCTLEGQIYVVKIPKKEVGSNVGELNVLKRVIENCSHPSLLRLLFTSDRGQGRYWLFFESYLESLRKFITRCWESKISPTTATILSLSRPLCSAVDCMHKMYISHSDIKPSNILLKQDPNVAWAVVPVLCDFGTALISYPSLLSKDSQPAADQQCRTTFYYAAPEQLLPGFKSNCIFQGDVWSLGAVLAELECREPLCPGSEDVWSKQLCENFGMWSIVVGRRCESEFELRIEKALREHKLVAEVRPHWMLLGTAASGAYKQFLVKLLELDPEVRLQNQLLEKAFVEILAQPAVTNAGPSASIVGKEGQPAAVSNYPYDVAELLYDATDLKTAKYCKTAALAFMEVVVPGALRGRNDRCSEKAHSKKEAADSCVPLTPQPVINWLYQVLAIALQTMQGFLGVEHRFNANGNYVSTTDETLQSQTAGGQCCVFWGTELGSRRDQAMMSYDFDGDIAVFVTDSIVFQEAWEKTSKVLQPLGLRLIEHNKNFKYRITPTKPLAYHPWTEFRHEARLENPGLGRCALTNIAVAKRKSLSEPSNPSGANCIDVEVYVVKPAADIKIRGTQPFMVTTKQLFPIVEGIFGPLRVPVVRTTAVLDAEYTKSWRTKRVVKVVRPGARFQTIVLPEDAGMLLRVWPSIPLQQCETLLGGFVGAGLDKSSHDIPWRFL